MNLTEVFWKNLESKTRITINQGGTSSSKTYSILQLLILLARENRLLISIVSESLPHLKRGAMRDFFNILESEGAYSEDNHNKTDYAYKIGQSVIEFFGADNGDKVRGARRDILFINECNNVPYHVYDQLEVRTKKRIYLDYNPVSEFWVHDKVLIRDDVKFIKSTYKDALKILDPEIIRTIESRKDADPNWWRVYGLGEIGRSEGIVFTNWQAVDEMPEEFKRLGYGLDFGFTNDPSALIDVGLQNGELWLDEIVYEKALTNDDLFNRAQNIDLKAGTVADSAEPKSIEELYRKGWNVKGAPKGKDSINQGIDILKRYKINVTKRSLNLIKEFRNYQWAQDKNGNYLNKPVDHFNHGIDAVRYVALEKLGKRQGKSWLNS